MAGDWIKMRVDLHEDLAVIAIAEATKLDKFSVVGRLWKVWAWADQQLHDSNAPGVTSAFLDRYVECDGFANAMQQVGWLKILSTGISFPHYERHNGERAKKRALTYKRVKRHRNAASVTPPLPEVEVEVPIKHPTVEIGTAPAREPEKPREEKSRSTPEAPASTPPQRPKRRTTSKSDATTQKLLAEQRAQVTAPKPENFPKIKPPKRTDWWLTPAGVAAKGREQDLVRQEGEEPVVFRARVMARLGDGPWTENLTRVERMLFDRFSAKPPPEIEKKPDAANAGQAA